MISCRTASGSATPPTEARRRLGSWPARPRPPARETTHAMRYADQVLLMAVSSGAEGETCRQGSSVGRTVPAARRLEPCRDMEENRLMRWRRLFALAGSFAAALTCGCRGSGEGDSSTVSQTGARGAVAAVAPMSVARAAHTSVLLPDGRVLIAGGFDNAGNSLPSTELFEPGTSRFRPAAPMQIARLDHTATALEDGRVLIAGGLGGGALPTAEV